MEIPARRQAQPWRGIAAVVGAADLVRPGHGGIPAGCFLQVQALQQVGPVLHAADQQMEDRHLGGVVPLDGALYVVGSNFGRPHHPAGSWNLLAVPAAQVSFRGERFAATAELLSPEAKAATWPRLIERWPLFDQYVERSGRDLRVFRLRRVDGRPIG